MPPHTNINDYQLMGDSLMLFRDMLYETDEFRNVTQLNIVRTPAFTEIQNNTDLTALSYIAKQGMEFTGIAYLYSISLTPETYNPSELYKEVKNGAAITPTLYDHIRFTPYKYITLKIDPECDMNSTLINNVDYEITARERLHNLLNDILDNPEEYRQKGKRRIVIRGVFNLAYNERDGEDYSIEL